MLGSLPFVVAGVAIWRPWVGLVALALLGPLGGLLPDVQEARGLTVIMFATAIGCLRFLEPRASSLAHFAWPASVLAVLALTGSCAGYLDWIFFQLAAGAAATYALVVVGVRSPRQATTVIWAMIGAAVVVAAISASEFAKGVSAVTADDVGAASRVHGVSRDLMQNPNYYPPYILPGLVLALALLPRMRPGLPRWLLTGAIAAMCGGVLATLSRGGIMTLLALWVAHEVLKQSRPSTRLLVPAAGLFAICAVLYVVYPTPLTLLAARFAEEESVTRWNSRSYLIVTDLARWRESPLVGHGIGSSLVYRGLTPHNGYTGLLAESGMLGFVAFYLGPLAIILGLWRLRRQTIRDGADRSPAMNVVAALLAGVIALLVMDAFNPIVYQRTALFVLALAALAIDSRMDAASLTARCFATSLGLTPDAQDAVAESPRQVADDQPQAQDAIPTHREPRTQL